MMRASQKNIGANLEELPMAKSRATGARNNDSNGL